MAKRQEKAYSLTALTYQVLMDGDVHSLEEIAEFIQNFMYKNNPIEKIKELLQFFLDKDGKIEKTKEGYKLKSGASLNDLIVELIADADAPLSVKDIRKKVAKKQNVPLDAVRLDLDDDKRFTKVVYKSKTYYYLSHRKKVNAKVYEILKKKNRPLSFQEIYRHLESEYDLKKEDVIFLPREDKNIKHFPGPRYTLRSKTVQKKTPKPIHNITRAELDRVVEYLKTTGQHLSPAELSKTVLNYPLEQTNLRLKLSRDPRLKRDDGTFYFEEEKKEQEIPVKIRDRVATDYFKVKARMVGNPGIHTVESLLEIYKINISHVDFDFYKKLLEDHLLRDEGIARVTGGWIRAENHPMITVSIPKAFNPATLPEPKPELHEEQLTEQEQQFLRKAHPEVEKESNQLTFRINPVQRKYGILPITEFQLAMLPALPGYYELTIQTNNGVFVVFVNRKKALMVNLQRLFSETLPESGGIMKLKPSEDSEYEFLCDIHAFEPEAAVPPEILSELETFAEEDGDIPLQEILFRCFEVAGGKSLNLEQLWAAVNTVRSAHRADILAVLLDYKCFERDPEKPGYYRFDASRKNERVSVVAEPEPIVTPETIPEEPVQPEVKESVKKPVEKPVVPTGRKKEKARAKKAATLKPASKRQRKIKSEEPLPEHLKRLKHFERKLPKLQNVRSLVVKPAGKESSRIGAVSAGRIDRPPKKEKIKKSKPAAPVLLKPKPLPPKKEDWNASSFVNPDKGQGHSELHMTLEVLKAFISRTPQIRKTDGSIVIFLDNNDIAVYFRIPPENPNCWIAWIPKKDIDQVEGAASFLTEGNKKAKYSEEGYWWSTQKFKGPKGNWRDNNILEGVEIVGKIIALMECRRK